MADTAITRIRFALVGRHLPQGFGQFNIVSMTGIADGRDGQIVISTENHNAVDPGMLVGIIRMASGALLKFPQIREQMGAVGS